MDIWQTHFSSISIHKTRPTTIVDDHAEDGKNKKKKEEEAIIERFRMLESEMVFDNIKKKKTKIYKGLSC